MLEKWCVQTLGSIGLMGIDNESKRKQILFFFLAVNLSKLTIAAFFWSLGFAIFDGKFRGRS